MGENEAKPEPKKTYIVKLPEQHSMETMMAYQRVLTKAVDERDLHFILIPFNTGVMVTTHAPDEMELIDGKLVLKVE